MPTLNGWRNFSSDKSKGYIYDTIVIVVYNYLRFLIKVKKCKDWQNQWKEANYENVKEKQRQAEEMEKKKQLVEEEEEEKAKLKSREKEVAHVEIKEPITVCVAKILSDNRKRKYDAVHFIEKMGAYRRGSGKMES